MNRLDRIIGYFAPDAARRREKARLALVAGRAASMRYDAATSGRRGASWDASSTDADAAARRRARMAFIARDMVRNTPFALRAQQVITNNTIGDGIIPKIVVPADHPLRAEGLSLIETALDTVTLDAEGRLNLYGLQRLAMNTIVDAGEVLILKIVRDRADGLPMPFQIKILEPDYLDDTLWGLADNGNWIQEGIEYDQTGARVAYHLFDTHPGTDNLRGKPWRYASTRYPADQVLHIYRMDRPGQMRGVTWFAPIALSLQDLGDYQDAQIMRQKIAACFAAFHKRDDASTAEVDRRALDGTLSPGLIQSIGMDEEVIFGNPPAVTGFDEFTTAVLRSIAAGMGISYEALTGNLSKTNFSSARMGRMEMDRNVSSWQWTMIIPQMLQPLGQWFREAWMEMRPEQARTIAGLTINWVPPHRILVDPAREVAALKEAVRAGFDSKQNVIRTFGFDPERVLEEQIADAAAADAAELKFDSDVRHVSLSGVTQAVPQGSILPGDEDETDDEGTEDDE